MVNLLYYTAVLLNNNVFVFQMSERYINVCTYCRSEAIMQNDLGMMSCTVCKIKFKFPAVKKVVTNQQPVDDEQLSKRMSEVNLKSD